MEKAVQRNITISFAGVAALFKKAFAHLSHNDPLRMAGATAFFTSFALPFILILLIQLLELLINPVKLRHEIFSDLSGIVGRQSTRQVVETLIAFRRLAHNGWITAFGFVFLLLVSTTLLMVIKGSINQLWRIKTAPGQSVGKRLRTRLQSVLIIVATGVLILASIVAETAKAQMGHTIETLFPSLAHYINSVFNYVLSLVFVTLWFGVIFRLLPDARAAWKVVFGGAFVTALLFSVGKHLLRLLLINSNIGNLYGASASVVLILLFVFYSSLILYFGAAFTHVWSAYVQRPIKALEYASHYEVKEIGKP